MSKSLIFDASAIFNFGHRGGDYGTTVIRRLGEEYSLLTPRAVEVEVLRSLRPEENNTDFLKAHFKVRKVPALPDQLDNELREAVTDLHSGEIGVLALGLALSAKVVIDEKAARKVARQLKLALTGTVGLLNEAIEQKWIKGSLALAMVKHINSTDGRLPAVGLAKTWAEYWAAMPPDRTV